MIKKVFSLALFLGLLMPFMVQAQPKIGYMNSQEVLQNLPQRKTMQKKLADFSKTQRTTFTEKASDYQKALTQFQNNKASMSQAEIDTTQKKLTGMQTSLNQLSNKLQQQYQQKRNQLINPILQKINDAIVAISKKNGLDFVLNKSIGGTGSVIFYASDDQMDITQQVIDYVKSNS